jgi:hypothetical protein
MQRSTEPNGGFTKSTKPIMPVISVGPYSFQHVNVAAQRRDAVRLPLVSRLWLGLSAQAIGYLINS